MDSLDLKIQAKLHEQFTEIKSCAETLSSSANFHPSDPYAIFRFDSSTPSVARFECRSLLLVVPERPGSPSDLHIVAQGRLEIDKDHLRATGEFRTHSFGSKVAYFRMKPDRLDHVYGAHFDIDLQNLSHPAFHAQMASLEDFKDSIQAYYDGAELPALNNPMQHILRNARIPSAQMDFFAFLLQVIADHLLPSAPSPSHRAAFADLIIKSKALMGSGFLHPGFQAPNSSLCYRSGHWYA